MPAPPRPKRFQIHLSTAVVLMLAAGALLGLNSIIDYDFVVVYTGNPEHAIVSYTYRGYGWPFMAWETVGSRPGVNLIYTQLQWSTSFNYKNLGIDLLYAIILLFDIWVISESLIRGRAARKAP
jgi:hypothetical protein